MSKTGGRDTPKSYICGHCLSAALDISPARAHRRCHSGAAICECGALEHRWGREIAERMAAFNHCSIDQIYERHGRKRRVLTEEQRLAAADNLSKARLAKKYADTQAAPLVLTEEDEDALAALLHRDA